MEKEIMVSTPSRICLFGEHQDYLGLEVIASAINLRFKAWITPRQDNVIKIKLSGENIKREEIIDLTKPIEYANNRDYLKSAVNVLKRRGYNITGFDVVMDSEIPIGKGMCSSTTMIVVFIKALLEAINHNDKDDAELIAQIGFEAEVTEFNEPGGMMDHYSSAIGGLVHLTFNTDETIVNKIDSTIPGCFILFDSLQDKDTTRVLASAKYPVLEAIEELNEYGISSVRDFVNDESNLELLHKLDDFKRKKLIANIENYKIQLSGQELLTKGDIDPIILGDLLKRHHENLRDGLGISTDIIEDIMETAYNNGALGGKINGSGGGGCCYVYALEKDCERIVEAVKSKGYPAIVLKQDVGVKKDI